jgi:hypothetical protein
MLKRNDLIRNDIKVLSKRLLELEQVQEFINSKQKKKLINDRIRDLQKEISKLQRV